MKHRIIFAEDQQLIRESLKSLLSEDAELDIIALAADGKEAVEFCRSLEPDIILLDIQMPVLNGFEAASQIRSLAHPPKVVFITTFPDTEQLRKAVELQADGFLLKDIPPEDFVQALKCVAQGMLVFQSELKTMFYADDSKRKKNPWDLTPKDIEYIQYIVNGLANKEIAKIDGCAEGTVKNRVSAILQKLSLDARTQIAVFAIRNKLISDIE